MVNLEHARALLDDMGLHTAAELLDAQAEKSMHGQHAMRAKKNVEPSKKRFSIFQAFKICSDIFPNSST